MDKQNIPFIIGIILIVIVALLVGYMIIETVNNPQPRPGIYALHQGETTYYKNCLWTRVEAGWLVETTTGFSRSVTFVPIDSKTEETDESNNN